MSTEEERWHVRLAPGEVKVLTLEQIDDLFRLDMIDADTLLRQEGAKEWLPLRVVAGLDEEEAVPSAAAPASAPPLPVVQSAPPPPVVQSAPPPPVVRSVPPPPPAPLPPPSERAPPPPPPVVQSAPPPPSERAPFARSPSFVPPEPVSARAPSFTPPPPSVPPPSFAPPAVAPISIAPPLPPPPASRAEPLLIGLVALLGLLLALHRNGALAALFASAGQAAAYNGFEASLGGPGFGTPRAVDALVAKTPALGGSAAAPNAKR